MIVFTVTPMVSVIWSRNARCTGLNGVNVASSMTASTRPSNSTGSTTSSAGGALPSAEEIRTYPAGTSVRWIRLPSAAAWPTSVSPNAKVSLSRVVPPG